MSRVSCHLSHVNNANIHNHGPSSSLLPQYARQEAAADITELQIELNQNHLLKNLEGFIFAWHGTLAFEDVQVISVFKEPPQTFVLKILVSWYSEWANCKGFLEPKSVN